MRGTAWVDSSLGWNAGLISGVSALKSVAVGSTLSSLSSVSMVREKEDEEGVASCASPLMKRWHSSDIATLDSCAGPQCRWDYREELGSRARAGKGERLSNLGGVQLGQGRESQRWACGRGGNGMCTFPAARRHSMPSQSTAFIA